MVSVDASPAGHEAPTWASGVAGSGGRAGWPKLFFATDSLEMVEGDLVLACGCLGSRSVDGGLCGLVSGYSLLRQGLASE